MQPNDCTPPAEPITGRQATCKVDDSRAELHSLGGTNLGAIELLYKPTLPM